MSDMHPLNIMKSFDEIIRFPFIRSSPFIIEILIVQNYKFKVKHFIKVKLFNSNMLHILFKM